MMAQRQLPIPSHFDPTQVGEVWSVPYQERAEQAKGWARQHELQPVEKDQTRICLMAIDVQNTFCIP
ncbi:MAG: isochorismatase, partial [Pseudanabaenales cyanobacterium]|nr:isochorismatase [Pseudanabaenales cyanobacterium]